MERLEGVGWADRHDSTGVLYRWRGWRVWGGLTDMTVQVCVVQVERLEGVGWTDRHDSTGVCCTGGEAGGSAV